MFSKYRKINLKKEILFLLIFVIFLIVFLSGLMILNKKLESDLAEINNRTEEKTIKDKNNFISENIEKIDVSVVRNVKAKINNINGYVVDAYVNEGDELLRVNFVPEKSSLISQVILEDGNFLEEEIGLEDIPLNQELDIQYNIKTNEIMLIVISG